MTTSTTPAERARAALDAAGLIVRMPSDRRRTDAAHHLSLIIRGELHAEARGLLSEAAGSDGDPYLSGPVCRARLCAAVQEWASSGSDLAPSLARALLALWAGETSDSMEEVYRPILRRVASIGVSP
jgi:hypothetical protein